MGFLRWWKRMTFEGKIKKELGEVSGAGRGKIIRIQELEKKHVSDPRRFRFYFIHRTRLSYHSLSLALEEAEVRKMLNMLDRALSYQD